LEEPKQQAVSAQQSNPRKSVKLWFDPFGGIPQITAIEKDLSAWMEEHEYESVQQLRGSLSQKKCENPSSFERAQYMRAISSYPVKAP
jgi:hypothetical protein